MRAVSALTTCTIAVAFVSMLMQAYMESQNLSRIMAMASGLARLERDESVTVAGRQLRPRVAVAYGSCSDVYVHVNGFLNYTEAAGAEQRPHDILSELDVEQSFGYYFARGAAAE